MRRTAGAGAAPAFASRVVLAPAAMPPVMPEPAARIRAAGVRDLPSLERFISSYTHDGTLLARTRANLVLHLRDFEVAVVRRKLVGCGALQVVDSALGEIRSVAVDPAWRGAGIGSDLLRALLADARRLGLRRVFCLTRRADFFAQHGFREVPKDRFPAKVWGDCLACPRRHACDEIAMELGVGPGARG
jgi:N-acetylglutamate synthase-like GNAT family acetyltransferase